MLGILGAISLCWMMMDSTSLCFSFTFPLPCINTALRSTDTHTVPSVCRRYRYSITPNTRMAMSARYDDEDIDEGNKKLEAAATHRALLSRRNILSKGKHLTTGFTAASLSLSALLSSPTESLADIEGVATPSTADPNPTKSVAPEGEGVVLYTTKSGLRYIDLREGTGRTPQYGNLCRISYRAFIKLPGKDSELQAYDSSKAYLIKHGNGRIIPGLDEGLHTLAVGGKRRVIIPPKLGYIGPGVLGPLPDSPWGRAKLNRLLESMIEQRGGSVVVDVELRNVMADEADQGYYEDATINPADFETLRQSLSATARDAREKGEAAVDFFDGIGGE